MKEEKKERKKRKTSMVRDDVPSIRTSTIAKMWGKLGGAGKRCEKEEPSIRTLELPENIHFKSSTSTLNIPEEKISISSYPNFKKSEPCCEKSTPSRNIAESFPFTEKSFTFKNSPAVALNVNKQILREKRTVGLGPRPDDGEPGGQP